MAKDAKPSEELGAKTKQAVEQSMEQTRGAIDHYFNFLQETVSSLPSGGTDLGEKLKSYAENNIAATHEFVRKLSHAKDFQEAIRIQIEFMQMQMRAFGEQMRAFGEHAKSLSDAYSKAATGAVKTPFKTSLE
jgi:hypothetical protein